MKYLAIPAIFVLLLSACSSIRLTKEGLAESNIGSVTSISEPTGTSEPTHIPLPTDTPVPSATPSPRIQPTPTEPPIPYMLDDENMLMVWDGTARDWQPMISLYEGWQLEPEGNERLIISDTTGNDVFVIKGVLEPVEANIVLAELSVGDDLHEGLIYQDEFNNLFALNDNGDLVFAFNRDNTQWETISDFRVIDGKLYKWQTDMNNSYLRWVIRDLPEGATSVIQRDDSTVLAQDSEGHYVATMFVEDNNVWWQAVPQNSEEAIDSVANFETVWVSTNDELEVHFSESLMEYQDFRSATVDSKVMDVVYDFIVNEVIRIAHVRDRVVIIDGNENLIFGKGVTFNSPLERINYFAVNYEEFFAIRDQLDQLKVNYVMEQFRNTRPPWDFENLLFVDEQGEITVIHRSSSMATNSFFSHHIDQVKMMNDGPNGLYVTLASSAGMLGLMDWNTIPNKNTPIMKAFECYSAPESWIVTTCNYPIIENFPEDNE